MSEATMAAELDNFDSADFNMDMGIFDDTPRQPLVGKDAN